MATKLTIKEDVTTFEDLDNGECFYINTIGGNVYYMKLNPNDYEGAVRLDSGFLELFDPDETVTPVNAEIIIS